jgi:hypothetical protein
LGFLRRFLRMKVKLGASSDPHYDSLIARRG